MKKMKKLASVALALVMALALAAPAFAAGNSTPTTGSITIKNAIPGQTYYVYRLLDVSYNAEGGTYSYKVANGWMDFFTTGAGAGTLEGAEGTSEAAKANLTGNVNWIGAASNTDELAAFAKAAGTYGEAGYNAGTIKREAIAVPVTYEKDDEGKIDYDKPIYTPRDEVVNGMAFGYYLVDSTTGALCSLDVTNPNAVISEKNTVPAVTKTQRLPNQVKIGDTVDYTITITVPAGAQAYVLEDTMGAGLELDLEKGITVALSNTEITRPSGISIETTENGFNVTFTQAFLDAIADKTNIVVTYSATITSEAGVVSAEGLPSDTLNNKAVLKYGEDKTVDTANGITDIKLFQFPVVKTSSDNKLLASAEFELYESETAANPIPLVKDSNGNYRAATAEEQAADGFVSAKIVSTDTTPVMVYGFGEGDYYLKETKAPAGYNLLADRVKVELKALNLTGAVKTEPVTNEDGTITTVYTFEGTAPQIVNYTGAELPSTGGMGTTIFYAVGGVLVVASGILFVTKKRMGE